MILRILLLLLLVAPISVQAAALQRASFANGLHLIVEEDHSAPEAIIEVWLKAGGRDEVPGKTGLAHVLEHMMFKGSKKLGPEEFSKTIAAMGGNDNAFTTTDYTAYFEIIPAARIDQVLGMEAERFGHLRLAEKDFAKEIKVVMEERRLRTDDDPSSRFYEELAATALKLHPYRLPVIGWMQDLKQLTIQDVRAFYHKHYVPGNAIVVVVGDVDFKHIKQVVGNTFGKLPKRPVPARFNPVEPEPLGPKRLVAHLNAKLPVVSIAIPVPVWHPGHNDREAAALAVATALLSSGRSALMTQELVDKKRLAFGAGAGYDPFGMGLDLWYAEGDLGAKQTPAGFEKGFWALIDRLASKPVSEKRLHGVKQRMIAAEVFSRDSLYLRAKEIGRNEVTGIGAENRRHWLDQIRKVTPEDVQKAVSKWLRRDRSTTGLLQPKVKS